MSRRELRQRARRRRRGLASLLTAALVLTMAVVGIHYAPWAAANSFTPAVSITDATPVAEDDEVRPGIIAGQDAVYQLSVSNTGGGQQYNTSITALVPNGVHFVESDALLGSPTVYTSGQTLPHGAGEDGQVPDGFQLWVWENVADLPQGATLDPTFTVRPNAGEFPVGGTIDIDVNAYTSNSPNLLPTFPGSSSVATDGDHTSGEGAGEVATPVDAVRIHKSEPSPESELLRGVHNNTTTYTLRVLYTGEGDTQPITVTDYLPAGLEYLGGGGIDNTQDSENLHDGNREYPGAGPLTEAPAPEGGGYLEEDSVETIELTDEQADELGLGEGAGGVYTRVTWTLPSAAERDAGTAQNWDEAVDASAAGEPGEFVIRYRAAVPLFENTLEWDGEAPTAESRGQAANLNNNNGPSTRHGATGEHTDATTYTNVAHVAGTYQGTVRTDSSTEVIDAVDLRILKDVETSGEGNAFVHEGLATYTLNLATSEYTSAADIVITDELENGLCPVIPQQDNDVEFQRGSATDFEVVDAGAWPGDGVAAECAYPSQAVGAELSGATLTALRFDPATGNFGLTFAVDDMDADDEHTLTYTARQNPAYIPAGGRDGPTVSGDAVANTVQVQATTDVIEDLDAVAGVGEEYLVWEDSEAFIDSEFTSISKHVLERDSGGPFADDADWVDSAEQTFLAGDEVWYRLRVNFPATIDTRNPVVTDFLPQGVEPNSDGIVYHVNGAENDDFVDLDVNGSSLRWEAGEATDGNRFVPAGTVLDIYLPVTVTGLSASVAAQDMPQNLMKFQQENTEGEIFFLRDDASITLDYGATLIKGVLEVDDDAGRDARSENDADGGAFGSDRDGIQVVQGETVTYRLDISAPPFETSNFQVWDVLPDGITAEDVDPSAFTLTVGENASSQLTATVLDPDHDDYPSVGSEHEGRSVVLFDVGADIDPGAEVTLTYDVTIPVGTLVSAELDNDAGIAAYDATTNTGATVTYVPEGPFDPEIDDALTVTGDDAYDDSNVYLPPASMTKERVSTEIPDEDLDLTDPNNDDGEIVQGEYVTFAYSVTLPANTSVAGGVLADDGHFAYSGGTVDYEFVDANVVQPEELPAGFELHVDTDPDVEHRPGTLTFPDTYDVGDEDETFTVEISVWVADTDASNPDHTPNLPHGAELENTARFIHSPPAGGDEEWTASDTVDYIEPNLQVAKGGSPNDSLQIGGDVTYTIEVTNPGDRPISYDNTIVDTVPEGLIVQVDSITGDGAWNAETREITWTVPQVPAADGEPITFGYDVEIGPEAAGGADFVNTVEVEGHTLPDDLPDASERRGVRADSDQDTVTTVDAEITKGVRVADSDDAYADSTTLPVGETVEYEVEVTLHPRINYWDAAIVDTLPEGLALVPGSASGPTESSESGTLDDDAWSAATVDANVVTWTYDADNEIASHEQTRTLHLTYQAVVTDEVASDELPNTAQFTWNRAPGNDETRESVEDGATVDVVHPTLEIAKAVNNEDSEAVEPGETFTYDLVVTNDGDTPAYNIVVTDEVPAGVVVDPDSISHGGVLTGNDPDTGGGTITWDHEADDTDVIFDGPLYPPDSGEEPQEIALSYKATLAASGHIGTEEGLTEFINTTQVDAWESFDDGGRSYGPSDPDTAEVTTAFPYLTLEKEPTSSDIAYAGEPFSWTLTARNTGEGAAYLVELTDTLPANWTYEETVNVTVAGSAFEDGDYDFDLTGSGEGDDRQQLRWSVDGEGDTVLENGEEIEVTFTAIPSEAALEEAGVTEPGGTRVPHVNTLTARAQDPTGSEGNADGPYSDPEDPANAYIHSADLALTKTGAEDPIVAGTDATTGWTIVVSNNGPDTAVGPFTVSDETDPLPEGLTVTGISGDGWELTSGINRGDDGATTFEVTRTDTEETLEPGDSFPPIEVEVSVAADVEPTEGLNNTAEVDGGRTHDPNEDNNDDDDPLATTTEADLAVEKVVNTEEPNAGEAITWQLNPRNNGPSVSQSTDEDPITITDTIPDGIFDVTEERIDGGDDWIVSASSGFPATGGDTLTFTYTGEAMPVDSAGSITITGTIDPSWTLGDDLTNTARITPGPTEDPNEGNNEDDVTVTPETETALGVTKTRTGTAEPVPGESVSYLITVSNTGPADAQNVAVVDELPDYLTYTSFEDGTGTWARADGPAEGDQHFALTDPNPLEPGESASFTITASLDPAYTDEVVNWVQASATNVPDEPRDSDEGSSDRQANLSIAKTHEGDAVAGETLDYTVTVTNEGPSYSSGPIEVEDILPAGFTYVPGSAQVSVAGGTAAQVEPQVEEQTLTWVVVEEGAELASGATVVITFTTAIADDVRAQTDLVNVAQVDGPEDTDPSDDRDDDPTNVVTRADMTITKDVEDGPWVAGTGVTYTFTVTNEGPSVADATVTDVWPTGLTGVSIEGAGWDCEDGTCTFEQHPVDTTTLTVVGEIDQAVQPGTELENTAELTWTDSRGSHDDEDTETVEVSSLADLELIKTAVDEDGNEIDTATAGEQARYLLEVTNHGPSQAAAPITVTDTLPEGVSYIGLAGDTLWDVTEIDDVAGQQQISFTMGDETALAAGAQAPDLTLIVHLDAGLPTTDEPDVPALVNSAVVSSPTEDPDETNNDDEAPLEVEQAADLAITKSHQGEAAIGEDLSFDVTVTNLGPSVATGVTVADTIPAGLDYVGYDGSDEAWTQVDDPVSNEDGTTTVTFALERDLDVEEQAPPLVVTTTVTATAYPEVTNVVVVDGDQPDRNPGNNEDPDNVAVPPLADLGIVKSLDGDTLTVGEAATYTLVVTNHGPTEHVGQIAIADELPTGLVATDVQSEVTECEISDDGALVECLTEETLAVDDTLTVMITVDVQAGAWTEQDPEATNVATVTGTSEDPEEENNTSTVTTTVTPDVRWELTKTRGDVDGDSVDWTITVSSVGLNDAVDGAVIVDRLPDELRFDGATSDAGVQCEGGDGNVVECEVPGPIAAGDSVSFTVHTTLLTEEVDTVTNTAWLIDPETGEAIPDTEDSADHRPGALSATGVAVGALVTLALLLLLTGAVVTRRARA